MGGSMAPECRTLPAVTTAGRSTDSSPVRAAIYCRISLSRLGDTVKVDEQEVVCRRLADARGWTVDSTHVFKDNSKSAWKPDRKRPGWDAMLTAIESHQIDAIIVYHGDRLIRAPRDLEDLLDLSQKKGIRLASPTGVRNLENGDDQFILRIEAAAQHREVSATSRRLKAMNDRRAEQGLARLGGRGGRAFGFEPDGMTIRDADADMIREVAARVLAGEAVGAICRDLNSRGYRTTAGNEWRHMSLKRLMQRPRLAGLLAHHGTIVGPAAWPAILPRDQWEAVVAVLERKAGGFGYTTNARRHLLSGLAVCGTCGEPLAIRQAGRRRTGPAGDITRTTMVGYGCVNPACPLKVHRSAAHLDAYVEGYVIGLLNDPLVRQGMETADPALAAQLATRLAVLQSKREATLAAFADDDEMGPDVLRVSVRRIDRQIAEVRADLAAVQLPAVLHGLWGIGDAGWDALDLSRQRSAVAALVRVTVLPARRGPGFDAATVRLDPPGGPPGSVV